MTLPSDTPEKLGLDQQRLERLGQWLQHQVSGNRLAGASVLVARRGSVGYFASAGDIGRESVVRLYSMTKPVTTVAAMMLYEKGCFQLDDPIALYLPEFADTPVWNGTAIADTDSADAVLDHVLAQNAPITVHQLMTHTSGLTYDFMQANPVDAYYRQQGLRFPGADESLASLVSRLAQAPLISQPGSAWNYSVSVDVLGRLIEVWTGQSLDNFLTREIFEPLGMHATGFHAGLESQHKLVDLYTPAAGGELGSVAHAPGNPLQARIARMEQERTGLAPPIVVEPGEISSFLRPPVLYSGGGGLVGSIDDYSRFCQLLLNGGQLAGHRLLSPKTVAFMRQNQLPDNADMAAMGQEVWSESSYRGVGFGLGFAVVVDPVKAQMITSTGECHWGGAASTFFWVDPVEDLQVVFLTQLYPSSTYPLRRELRTLVYQALAS